MKKFSFPLIALFGMIGAGVVTAPHASIADGETSGYQGKPFDITALQSLISDNSVKTLDQLVSVLPDNYKKHFVLMNESGSLQSASKASPRVIAYGNYEVSDFRSPGENLDRLYLAFQTDTTPAPGSKLPNSLEVIEWSPAKKSYLFYQLDFPITAKSFTPTTTCMQCHGSPLRPNWTAYPRWDGAIGNANALDGAFNVLSPKTTTADAQKLFSTLQTNNTRLKGFDFSQYLIRNLEDPNANLSSKIHEQLSVHNVEVLKQRDDYASLKYAIAGAVLGCVNVQDFFSPSVFSGIQSGVFNALKNAPLTSRSSLVSKASDLNYQNTFDLTGALYQKNIRFQDYQESVAMTTWLRYLYEGQGKPEVLKTLMGSPPMDPTSSNWNYDLISFGGGWDTIKIQYLKNLNDDSELNGLDLYDTYQAETRWRFTKFGLRDQISDPDILENGPAKELCQTLALKSQAVANFPAANLSSTTIPPVIHSLPPEQSVGDSPLPILQAATPAVNEPLANFTHYCMECHDPDDGNPLPLDNLAALKAYRSSRGESIAERLTRTEMPPVHAPQPSDAVRKAMVDAVQ